MTKTQKFRSFFTIWTSVQSTSRSKCVQKQCEPPQGASLTSGVWPPSDSVDTPVSSTWTTGRLWLAVSKRERFSRSHLNPVCVKRAWAVCQWRWAEPGAVFELIQVWSVICQKTDLSDACVWKGLWYQSWAEWNATIVLCESDTAGNVFHSFSFLPYSGGERFFCLWTLLTDASCWKHDNLRYVLSFQIMSVGSGPFMRMAGVTPAVLINAPGQVCSHNTGFYTFFSFLSSFYMFKYLFTCLNFFSTFLIIFFL